jgi:hypothetical protein
MTEFHHGITARETASGKIPIRNADTNTIAILAYADDADEETFPLNKPVLVTSINRVLPKAGTQGNLRKNLEIISVITSPTLVVIRILNPFGDGFIQSRVIGTTDESGQRTGLQALLTVKSVLGITPKIICVSDTETIDVANALGAICKKLRAYAYITPRNEAAEVLPTAEDVTIYREKLAFREIELIWPEWTSGNVFLGDTQSNEATPPLPPFPSIPDENISDYIEYSGWFGLTWLSDIEWQLEANGVLYKQTTPTGIEQGQGYYNTADGSLKQIIGDHNLPFSAYEDSSGNGTIRLNEVGEYKLRFIPQSLTTEFPNKYPAPRSGAIPIIDPATKIWSLILKKTGE